MNLDEAQGLLQRVLNREPGLIFDVLQPPSREEQQLQHGVPVQNALKCQQILKRNVVA